MIQADVIFVASYSVGWFTNGESTKEEREKPARGAKIYCEIAGFGMSGDAFHITSPAEDGAGAVASMRNALSDAGTISPEDLDLFRFVDTAEDALNHIDNWHLPGTRRDHL